MRSCKWKTRCTLLGIRSMRETIQDICGSLDHSGISPWAYGYAITNLVSVSAYPKSSADSTASVHTMSVFTKCPISLCAAPRVLMHSVLPHPLGPIIHTWEKKAGVFIVPLNISSRNRHCMPLTSSEHKKKCCLGLICSKLIFHLMFSEEKKSVFGYQGILFQIFNKT